MKIKKKSNLINKEKYFYFSKSKILKNRITQFKAILIMLNERKLLSYLKEYNLK